MTEIVLANRQKISVRSPFKDGVGLLQDAIIYDQSGGSYGHTWPLACAFARSGVDWPGWVTYHTNLREAYHHRLGENKEYRSSVWRSERERKSIMWGRHDTCRDLHGTHYIPDGVMLPTYLEGPPAIPSAIRTTALRKGLPDELIDTWFLKSFASKQFHLDESLDHDPTAWDTMKEVGLVVSAADIDPYEALCLLDFATLRAALRHLNLPGARSISEARSNIYNKSACDDLRSYLHDHTPVKRYWKILAPDGIDWMDFQSWRQQIKGMGEAISDIYAGSIKKTHPDRAILCG